MPFDPLGFFSGEGSGDQFAVSTRGNRDVYVWNHEDESRTWVAPTFVQLLEEWMTRRPKV